MIYNDLCEDLVRLNRIIILIFTMLFIDYYLSLKVMQICQGISMVLIAIYIHKGPFYV